TKNDLISYHKRFISPQGAVLALVGDIEEDIAAALIEQYLGSWSGPEIADCAYPAIEPATARIINKYMNGDQVALCLGKLSVPPFHPDFDKLVLFQCMFTDYSQNSLCLSNLRNKDAGIFAIDGCL